MPRKRLHKDMTKAEARLADNGSEQTVDRLHKDMTKAEARLADNGVGLVGRITACGYPPLRRDAGG